MKKILSALLILGGIVTSCKQETMNPLTSPSNEKFGIEPYSLITIDHYREAFEHGMKAQNENIQAIVEDTAAPNFHNTIEAFDKSGDELQRTSLIFSALSGSNSTEEIRKFETEIYPKLASHSDDLYLNAQLFQRIKTVYDHISTLETSDTAALHRLLNREQRLEHV